MATKMDCEHGSSPTTGRPREQGFIRRHQRTIGGILILALLIYALTPFLWIYSKREPSYAPGLPMNDVEPEIR
jgi:hypothetical protein